MKRVMMVVAMLLSGCAGYWPNLSSNSQPTVVAGNGEKLALNLTVEPARQATWR